MNIIYYCLYIYLLLKPFYIFKSGSMQPSDLFLVFAFIFLLILKKKELINKNISKNIKFLLFTICTFAINGLYFIAYVKTKFLLSSLYFVFNFLAIILFSIIFEDDKLTNNISKLLKIDILVQVLIFLLGLGRWYGRFRYMGTFNDPNQFGYFILMSYMFIYLISEKNGNKKGNILFLLLSIFLIFECASTGMFLGINIFLLLQFLDIIRNFTYFIKCYKYRIVICTLILMPILVLFLIFNHDYNFIKPDKFFMLSRIEGKVDKMSSTNASGDVSLIQERGYDRFIYYPQYVLYGSGEGEYTRFELTYHQDEIHATFPSILFYYGIIPTLILLSWIFDKIKDAKPRTLIPLIAALIESFTLLNQRQVLFWILILFISYMPKRTRDLEMEGK